MNKKEFKKLKEEYRSGTLIKGKNGKRIYTILSWCRENGDSGHKGLKIINMKTNKKTFIKIIDPIMFRKNFIMM